MGRSWRLRRGEGEEGALIVRPRSGACNQFGFGKRARGIQVAEFASRSGSGSATTEIPAWYREGYVGNGALRESHRPQDTRLGDALGECRKMSQNVAPEKRSLRNPLSSGRIPGAIAGRNRGDCPCGISKPLANRTAVVQPGRPAVGRRGDEIERDAEFRVDRRGNVLGPVLVVGRTAPLRVRAAKDGSARNAGAGHDGKPGGGPVVPAGGGVYLGRPAEVGQPDDKRVGQHAAIAQVGEQGRQRSEGARGGKR